MLIVQFLKDWQEIIGAFIGGISGILGAGIVSYNDKRREEKNAAIILIPDLLAIQVRTDAAKQWTERAEIPEEYKKAEFVNFYLINKPIHSSFFDVSASKVTLCHYNLSIHLSAFSLIYRSLEESFKEIELGNKIVREVEKIYKGIHLASEHARCIVYMLETFVLPSYLIRTWNRMVILIPKKFNCQSDTEKCCEKLRKNP